MLADLDLALKRPAELVQRLYAEDPSLDGFEKRVAETFSRLLSDDKAVQQVHWIVAHAIECRLTASHARRSRR